MGLEMQFGVYLETKKSCSIRHSLSPNQVVRLSFVMDEFINQILSSSSWIDVSGVDRTSLDGSTRGPANCMPSGSVGVLEGISRESSMPLMPSSCTSANLEGQGQISNNISGRLEQQQELRDPVIASPVAGQDQHDSRSPMGRNARVQGGQESMHLSAGGSVVLQLNTDCSVSAHGGSSQVLPTGGAIRAGIELPSPSSRGSSGSEASGFQQCQGDTHSQPPTESLWSKSYMTGVQPIPSVLGQGKSESFRLHGETAQEKFLGKRPRQEQEMLETENRSVASGLDGLRGTLLTNNIGSEASQTPLTITVGTQLHQQNPGVQMLQPGQGNSSQQHGNHSSISQPQYVATAGAAVNAAARPRVRARRGQATDPHSIAERLRRERIAERMKALQELVPNSNKTDKASMLDEIIDYVKFLQLQVKVLSMSRLGGAGAVAPLIADLPSKGAGTLISASLGQAGGSLCQTQDGLAFEQKVAKLMESNMTTAMQYLQNKGLCLMPIALATAISSSTGKPMLGAGSMKAVDNNSGDGQNSDMQPAVLPVISCSTGVGTAAFGDDSPVKENPVKKRGREETATDKSVAFELLPSNVPKVGLKK